MKMFSRVLGIPLCGLIVYTLVTPIESQNWRSDCGPNNTLDCVPKGNNTVNGGVSQWSEWTACTKDCEGGIRTRSRLCNSPLPRCDGMECNETLVEAEPCNTTNSCCHVTDWSAWTNCTTACDDGERTRSRSYFDMADEYICDRPLQQITNCPENLPCGKDCNVTDWSDWPDCDIDCGEARITRYRTNFDKHIPECAHIAAVEEDVCSGPDCTCQYPRVWSNNSLCHKQTCDDRFVPPDCDEKRFPDCVCPEGMYDRMGVCVELEKCYLCEIDGKIRENGEMWTPDGTCDLCQCVDGENKCTPNVMVPDCKAGEEVTYENGPCCPTCTPKKPTCELHTNTSRLQYGKYETDEITYQYCAGSCGDSVSVPMLSTDALVMNTEDTCKCCIGIVNGTKPVTLNCDNNGVPGELYAYIPNLVGCECNACNVSHTP